MASKPTALATLTNTNGKRAADNTNGGDGVSSIKKLKSHNRTMTMDEAKQHLAEADVKIKAKAKIIRDRQHEISELKKQLATAENSLTRARNAKAKIEDQNAEARKQVKSDADLIIEKVKDASKHSYRASESLGKDAFDDMISLGDDSDILRLTEEINTMNNNVSDVCVGAIRSIIAAHKQQSSFTLAKALRVMYLKILSSGGRKSIDYKVWPLVASAMNIGTTDVQDPDTCTKEYGMFSSAVLEKFEEMKGNDPNRWGSYRASEDKCPIIELLVPVHDATEHEGGNAVKTKLMEVMKEALLTSVSEVEKPANYAMPTEAAIAGKQGHPEIKKFLLSPNETSLSLNLSKNGRMGVHRLIDNQIGYGKLSHQSEGYGRERYLVIRRRYAT